MAIRTTAEDVMALMAPGEDYDTVNLPSLTGFMASANAVTNRVATCAVDKGIPLNTEELDLIERWLTAYFYTRSDPIYQSKSTGGQSASFVADAKATTERYKAGAMAVDPSGCLDALLNNLRASTAWLGRNPNTQTDWENR